MNSYNCIADDVKLGTNVRLSKFINLYGCEIGDETKIGAFVEIQKNASVGKRCKISSHTFICEGVVIEDNVFIGHGVTFINDSYPRATTRRRKSANRSRLEGRTDGHKEGCIHRLRRHDSLPTPTSARTRLWAPAAWSPKMSHPTLSWPEIRPRFCVTSNRLWKVKLRISNSVPDSIPFLDLITPHVELEQELTGVFRRALLTRRLHRRPHGRGI